MRPTAGLLAASALVTLSAPATGGTAAPARACYREGARTLRSNAEVRVYRRDFDRVYGCAFATGKRRLLGSSYTPPASSSGGGGITNLRLAGHYVAVVSVLEDQAGRLAAVTVTNLRSARTVYDWDV